MIIILMTILYNNEEYEEDKEITTERIENGFSGGQDNTNSILYKELTERASNRQKNQRSSIQYE